MPPNLLTHTINQPLEGLEPGGVTRTNWFEFEGQFYRIVVKPTHTVIYKRYGKGPFVDHMIWNSRKEPRTGDMRLHVGGVVARILASRA